MLFKLLELPGNFSTVKTMEKERFYSYCQIWPVNSFIVGPSQSFQLSTANELAYSDLALHTTLCHMGHMHWTYLDLSVAVLCPGLYK